MSIHIFLENYYGACNPGQTISGRIECTFNKEKKLRAIRVKFRGRASTSWSESESYYDSVSKKNETRSVTYSAEETYMNTEYNLIQGGENFRLGAGKHVYPFSHILPSSLPSSFEGSDGSIRYYIKAVVDRSSWKFNYKSSVPLNVSPFIDLNFIPGLRNPVGISDDKTMCSCWCNDAGALTFNISMPFSGYVPGQEINIGAYVGNLTNVTAERVQFKLTAGYKYITHSPSTNTRYNSKEITKCSVAGIGAHGEKSWTSTLVIPTNQIYPNLMHCSIIKVYYKLEGEVVLPFPHKNLRLKYPITIGSVALSNENATISGPTLRDNEFDPPEYLSPNNFNSSHSDGVSPPYQEKYLDGDVPPPYPSEGREGGGPGKESAPYLPDGGSGSYPSSAGASAPYPSSSGVLSSYLPEAIGWLVPKPEETTASAPPPSYEESQPSSKSNQERKLPKEEDETMDTTL